MSSRSTVASGMRTRSGGARGRVDPGRAPLQQLLGEVAAEAAVGARGCDDGTELRADTADELDGLLALDHQQRPVVPVPPRYPVAPPPLPADPSVLN